VPEDAPTERESMPERARRGGLLGWLFGLWRLLVAVAAGFRGEALGLRAGNLTFVTVTSLVPLAAVILSLVHLFGADRLDRLVKGFFAELLSPGGEQTVRAFFSATNVRAAGSVSFLVVMVSAGVLVRHLDASLNEIWAVRRPRPLWISLGLYAGVLLLGPVLIVGSLLGSEGVRLVVQWLDLPTLGSAFEVGAASSAMVAFTLLYRYAPHAPVAWRSAFTGGLVAGLTWELARHLYGGIASLILSANMLYGSLGVAPLFLTWVYVGWYIVLAGARLAYAVEHADFHDEFADLLQHPRSQELIASRIAELLTRTVVAGKPGQSTRALAESLRMPEQRIIELSALMTQAGLLALVGKDVLVPARDPKDLTLADVSQAVGGAAALARREHTSRTGQFEDMARRFTLADDATVEKLKQITWLDLIAPGVPGGPKP
jgi:membrane protein